MKRTINTLAIAVGLALGGVAMAQAPIARTVGPHELKQDLERSHGYTVQSMKIDDGFWHVRALDKDNNLQLIKVDLVGGEVVETKTLTNLTKQEVIVTLDEFGFENVRNVQFEDGMWTAEAGDPDGPFDLRIDPENVEVVAVEWD